ncbi:MAG: hypothetical protein M4D80_29925 [Myxococcota bacterium]|nr:hypothetical protein [Deltaproteobacteria bacterium]MDQ3339404.1 hypothetical protein [Myxococcota bacterium]
MRYAFVVALFVAIGCNKEIGDDCVVSSDCSPSGDRFCDSSSRGGYCTIQGCDFNTCPDEAVCVRFFTGSFTNRPCDPTATQEFNGCTLDELCSLIGSCVPRSAELRFCMKKCDDDDDCRDGYECRDLTDMRARGGEPVMSPGTPINDETAERFCATAGR